MRFFLLLLLLVAPGTTVAAGGPVTYQVQGERFEGYYLSPGEQAPLVLLVHDWDGLTD